MWLTEYENRRFRAVIILSALVRACACASAGLRCGVNVAGELEAMCERAISESWAGAGVGSVARRRAIAWITWASEFVYSLISQRREGMLVCTLREF